MQTKQALLVPKAKKLSQAKSHKQLQIEVEPEGSSGRPLDLHRRKDMPKSALKSSS